MALPLNQSVFGKRAQIVISGEEGVIVGFCLYQRSRSTKQFFLQYKAADGRACEDWFDENQLELI